MILRIFKFVVICLSCFMFTQVNAKEYKPDINYKVISQNITRVPEVREYFSFFCSHCFALRPSIEQISNKFKNVNVVYNPIGLLGGEIGVESQYAFAIAQNEGVEQEFTEEFFTRVHINNEFPHDMDYFINLMESLGVPAEKYKQDRNAFVIMAKVSEFDRHMKDANIEAVPEIVVNGKYLAVLDDVENEEQFLDLIGFLLTLK